MITLQTLKVVTREARNVEEILPQFRELAKRFGEMTPRDALNLARKLGYRAETTLRFIDALTLCHGVEAFEGPGGYFEYCNTGDSYAETVVLRPSGAFSVTSWGDVVESRAFQRWEAKRAA